ncbi:MAG: hypothetical protein D6B25_13770 [Desulfobulbaceae bacterium]|nr:MAG: hypothetical protein D6B25_13770 [Desulfobulbaceae bacterium]
MKRKYFLLAVLLTSMPLLQQCATRDDINQLHYQIRRLDNKITEMQNNSLDKMQKRQAATTAQVDKLDQDFLQLKSSLEESGHLNRRLIEQTKELDTKLGRMSEEEKARRQAEQERFAREQKEKDLQIAALEAELKNQRQSLQAIEQARLAEMKRKADEAKRRAEEARKAAVAAQQTGPQPVKKIRTSQKKKVFKGSNRPAPSSISKPTPPPPSQQSNSVASGNAQTLYKNGQYRQAYAAFGKIAQSKSGTNEAIEARFMMGESLFALKEYDQAILEYQSIIINSPSSRKAPAAMLRQGTAFQNLNELDTARILFDKILIEYPDSPEAAQAQTKLDKLP